MKKFLIIGNMNAITYKEIFPLIKNNKIWLGFRTLGSEMYFQITDDYKKQIVVEKKEGSGWKIVNGEVMGRIANACWFTNLMHDKRLEGIYCPQKYVGREDKYPVYDNYDAIEIGHHTKSGKWEGSLDELPYDYDGVMGVPITFLDHYSTEQFEIVGITENADYIKEMYVDGYEKYDRPYINGKRLYPRILIRRKK